MENKSILVIEDDKEINHLLCDILEQNNFRTTSAHNGNDGLELTKTNTYDLILLDLMLPYKSGDNILKELRSFSQVPVVVISAKDLTQTKIELLKLGADDYITKPFDLDEVLARVESVLRRCISKAESNDSHTLTYRNIELNSENKSVEIDGSRLMLTAKEYKILKLLITHPKKVFSKANLFESIWKEEYFGDDNTLNVHMSNLRNKLKLASNNEEYIETIWGLGYRLIQN